MQTNHIYRYEDNPVISVKDVKPTNSNMEVVGIFNCGGAFFNGKIYLICRIAEIIISQDKKTLLVPTMTKSGFITTKYNKNDSNLDLSDPRTIKDKTGKVLNLSSYSSLRLAVSDDGYRFNVEDNPCIEPDSIKESWGMEDPRVAEIEGKFYITYSSVSENGVGVSLSVTEDFKKYKSLGMILPPTNKDTVLFPEQINNRYYMLHRPSPFERLGDSDIWLADSPNLTHWGNHKHLSSSIEGEDWESSKIGAGSTPIHIPAGWLVFYHGVDKNERYSMGYLLLDYDDPSNVIYRSKKPIMEPIMAYEKSGFFSETVFPCTAILLDNKIVMYYGAADSNICRVDIKLDKLLR
jgi:predicted GH43/DUF377 family glycosyl hydrolase